MKFWECSVHLYRGPWFTYISDSVSPGTAFLVVTILLFKASWTESFNEGKPQEFTKLNGKRVEMPMMNRDSRKQIFAEFTTELIPRQGGKCIALAIPYEVCIYFAS